MVTDEGPCRREDTSGASTVLRMDPGEELRAVARLPAYLRVVGCDQSRCAGFSETEMTAVYIENGEVGSLGPPGPSGPRGAESPDVADGVVLTPAGPIPL